MSNEQSHSNQAVQGNEPVPFRRFFSFPFFVLTATSMRSNKMAGGHHFALHAM
jgi:hypothetical protein